MRKLNTKLIVSAARHPQNWWPYWKCWRNSANSFLVVTHLDRFSDWVSRLPMADFYYNFSTNETSTHLKCLMNINHLTCWSIVANDWCTGSRCQPFFYLVSVWNIVRELLALSIQCMACRSSRLAVTFVPCDLVFLSSKVYIFTWVINVLVHLTLLKLA
jgi:hypothetical protein